MSSTDVIPPLTHTQNFWSRIDWIHEYRIHESPSLSCSGSWKTEEKVRRFWVLEDQPSQDLGIWVLPVFGSSLSCSSVTGHCRARLDNLRLLRSLSCLASSPFQDLHSQKNQRTQHGHFQNRDLHHWALSLLQHPPIHPKGPHSISEPTLLSQCSLHPRCPISHLLLVRVHRASEVQPASIFPWLWPLHPSDTCFFSVTSIHPLGVNLDNTFSRTLFLMFTVVSAAWISLLMSFLGPEQLPVCCRSLPKWAGNAWKYFCVYSGAYALHIHCVWEREGGGAKGREREREHVRMWRSQANHYACIISKTLPPFFLLRQSLSHWLEIH